MKCAALDWDKTKRDYVECDDSVPRMVRLAGMVTVQLPLCAVHEEVFEKEMAAFGGALDRAKRVTWVSP